MRKKITVNTSNLNTIAPLYHYYPSQRFEQPAYIEIDIREDEIRVSADYDSNVGGGVSSHVWNGLIKHVSCPPCVLGSEIEEYLNSSEFHDKIKEYNYEEVYKNGNYVGVWGENEFFIDHSIEEDLQKLDMAEVYDDAKDWMADSLRFFDKNGKECCEEDAIKAFWGNPEIEDEAIEITTENLEKLVNDANSCIEYNQLVVDIEDTFKEIINAMRENKI